MFIKAPCPIPHDFLREFCYPGPRRFIAFYWTPFGDDACFDDGQSSACGLSDNDLFLRLQFSCGCHLDSETGRRGLRE